MSVYMDHFFNCIQITTEILFFLFIFHYRKIKDESDMCGFERATSRMSVGASLRASSRAEIGSNLLHRSVSIRRSTKATQCPPLEGLANK